MNPNNRQKLLVLIAAGTLAVMAVDRLVVSPLLARWKARNTRISELSRKVEDARQLVERETVLRPRWSLMRTNTLSANRPVAEAQVLKAFDRWAQASRLSILSIHPQWKQDSDDYVTLDLRVEASGSLSAVSRFLYELERDPLALRVQSIETSSRDNDGQQIALGLQVSGLSLVPPRQSTRP